MSKLNIQSDISYVVKWSKRDFVGCVNYDETQNYLKLLVSSALYDATYNRMKLMKKLGYKGVSLKDIKIGEGGIPGRVDVEINFYSWSKKWKVVSYYGWLPNEIIDYYKLLMDIGLVNAPTFSQKGNLLCGSISD